MHVPNCSWEGYKINNLKKIFASYSNRIVLRIDSTNSLLYVAFTASPKRFEVQYLKRIFLSYLLDDRWRHFYQKLTDGIFIRTYDVTNKLHIFDTKLLVTFDALLDLLMSVTAKQYVEKQQQNSFLDSTPREWHGSSRSRAWPKCFVCFAKVYIRRRATRSRFVIAYLRNTWRCWPLKAQRWKLKFWTVYDKCQEGLEKIKNKFCSNEIKKHS